MPLQKIAALVPLRHESTRVPGKNYRLFAGRPLFHWIVQSLLDCPSVDEVVLDTDSPLIMEDTARTFPRVHVIERAEQLRGDTIPMNEVLLSTTQQVPADGYLQTHSTNPLLSSETIARAIRQFRGGYPIYDSLFGVTRLHMRLWDGLARPMNHNPAILLRTQDLPPVYEENSCIYLFTREGLEANHNRIGRRPLMFEIGALEAFDIDEEIDFRVAEGLFRAQQMVQEEAR